MKCEACGGMRSETCRLCQSRENPPCEPGRHDYRFQYIHHDERADEKLLFCRKCGHKFLAEVK